MLVNLAGQLQPLATIALRIIIVGLKFEIFQAIYSRNQGSPAIERQGTFSNQTGRLTLTVILGIQITAQPAAAISFALRLGGLPDVRGFKVAVIGVGVAYSLHNRQIPLLV